MKKYIPYLNDVHVIINPCCSVNTVWCRYNAVSFLQNPYKIYPIARPWASINSEAASVFVISIHSTQCFEFGVIIDKLDLNAILILVCVKFDNGILAQPYTQRMVVF